MESVSSWRVCPCENVVVAKCLCNYGVIKEVSLFNFIACVVVVMSAIILVGVVTRVMFLESAMAAWVHNSPF